MGEFHENISTTGRRRALLRNMSSLHHRKCYSGYNTIEMARPSHIKIAIVGECGVGKTSITRRFLNKQVSDDLRATIGVDKLEMEYQINGNLEKISLLDMAGSYQFKTLVESYLKQADAIIFVYDLTDKESFAALPLWNSVVSKCVGTRRDIVKVLVGNKKDLAQYCREVSFRTAKTYANFEGMVALEVSAKNDDNIDLIFECVAQEVTSKRQTTSDWIDANEAQGRTTEKRTVYRVMPLFRQFKAFFRTVR